VSASASGAPGLPPHCAALDRMGAEDVMGSVGDPGANHLLVALAPDVVADALASFWART
jgi:hypothetical protein